MSVQHLQFAVAFVCMICVGIDFRTAVEIKSISDIVCCACTEFSSLMQWFTAIIACESMFIGL